MRLMSSTDLTFEVDTASANDIEAHLSRCDRSFQPCLSSRVCLKAYAEKIRRHGVTFEAWANGSLVGLVAGYFNDRARREAFLTNASVEQEWRRHGVATALMSNALTRAKDLDFLTVRTEVQHTNNASRLMCLNLGFKIVEHHSGFLVMSCACV